MTRMWRGDAGMRTMKNETKKGGKAGIIVTVTSKLWNGR